MVFFPRSCCAVMGLGVVNDSGSVSRDLMQGFLCSYVVLNRPWAIVQWLKQATLTERYVLMSEPDHIWLKPMPNLMRGETPAAFPFFYIEPAKASNVPLVEKFTGKLTRSQIESISPIGET